MQGKKSQESSTLRTRHRISKMKTGTIFLNSHCIGKTLETVYWRLLAFKYRAIHNVDLILILFFLQSTSFSPLEIHAPRSPFVE